MKWKKLLKWAAITVAGILLFLWGKEAAFAQRGYEAVGGEYLLLPLPLWWALVETTIKDFIKMYRDAVKPEEKGDEDATDSENGEIRTNRSNRPPRSKDG